MVEPIFKIQDNRNVWVYGSVIIEEVEHLCVNGFIKCSSALNGHSWNTMKRKESCKECFPISREFIQLELFE